ncbi:MAG: hydrogenase nickel incorporation protein HypB [Deltaproteobacteria bacterium]|nr:hydrogenase nickel incorporation protein HypB [Deltaproteobacteria bacterium]
MEAGKRINVVTKILAANDRVADENRRRFAELGLKVVNLISSPGAGKTALLEATIGRIRKDRRVGVIVGDIATTKDAERIAKHDVPVVQITTESFGGSCHLEASTIRQALDEIPLKELDLLFVENVGNLVCPAEFDLGEQAKVSMLSVTEGEDKPLKYPLAFQVANLVILSKVDLVPHLRVDMEALRANVRQMNPKVRTLELSSQTGEGFDAWIEWLKKP